MTKEVTFEKDDLVVESIAKEYVKKDRDFSHINLSEVRFVRVFGKEPKNKVVEVRGIEEPESLFTDFKYLIVVYSDIFDNLSKFKQNVWVEWALTSIGEDFDGKKRKEDIKEHSRFLSKYGAYWQSEDDDYLMDRAGLKAKE